MDLLFTNLEILAVAASVGIIALIAFGNFFWPTSEL